MFRVGFLQTVARSQTAPSPVASVPSNLSPAVNPSNFDPQCADLLVSASTCLVDNFLSCDYSFSSTNLYSDSGGELFSCNTVATACAELSCCPPCMTTGKAYYECESSALGCTTSCANVASSATTVSIGYTSVVVLLSSIGAIALQTCVA
jgi:hypothetical protein